MAISNCICNNCDHVLVCSIYEKKIAIFSDEARTQLGVDIRLEHCNNFKAIDSADE